MNLSKSFTKAIHIFGNNYPTKLATLAKIPHPYPPRSPDLPNTLPMPSIHIPREEGRKGREWKKKGSEGKRESLKMGGGGEGNQVSGNFTHPCHPGLHILSPISQLITVEIAEIPAHLSSLLSRRLSFYPSFPFHQPPPTRFPSLIY